MADQILKTMFNIFWKAVQSVQMQQLIRTNFHYKKSNDTLEIFDFTHNLKNKDVHLVGAGKAVYQMATEVELVLGSRLKSGIVSVPKGILSNQNMLPNSVIEYCEGAENNLPDRDSQLTTKKIIDLVKRVDENCCLLVLLSGGGSALLTAPSPPITLQEKCDLISKLAKAGANIIELNTVRKRISDVKGGKLSIMAHPAEVITLLVSDILKHSDDFIASGPTFQNNDNPDEALNVIKKYELNDQISKSVLDKLRCDEELVYHESNVSNYVLANNILAVNAAHDEALNLGLLSNELSYYINGDVQKLSNEYSDLVCTIIQFCNDSIDLDCAKGRLKMWQNIDAMDNFFDRMVAAKSGLKSGVCIVSGGEPTVNVKGGGKGGRNQQLALSFSVDLESKKREFKLLENYDVYLFCAGTDGIDGPTDAAGAIGYDQLVMDAKTENLNPDKFIKDNDSYSFYERFADGKYHIKTGHTNTNVMDIHILVIREKLTDCKL